MKKINFLLMLLVSVVVLTCCSAEDPFEEYDGNNSWNNVDNMPVNNGNSATGELSAFDIATDKTSAEPTDVAAEYFPDEEDILENNEFTTEVMIDFSTPSAQTKNGVEVTVNGNHVMANHGETKKVCYVLSGTTANGSFTVLGNKKYAVRLNSVNITNPDSAALNLLSSKRAFIILADGTTNTLADGTGGGHKGALYGKGKLLFNGSGSLSVIGNTNNGIHSADYIVLNKGNNVYVKSTVNNGIKANDGVYINGGILNVEVTASDAKGINCESHIVINGGRTIVLASGYDSEGIQADSTLTIAGGEVACHTYDDAINSKGNMTISGGYVYAHGQHNDGLDANGNCYIKGGTVYAICSGSPEVAIDANTEGGYKLYVTGGTIMALGGLENGSSLTQSCYQTSSWTANSWYALGDDTSTFSFHTPSSGGSGLVVSSASQPSLQSDISVSGGTSYFCGIGIENGIVSGGSLVSLSGYTGGNGMGGGPGGGGPGGWH